MTKEAAIKWAKEIKAFQEGKQIQVFTRKWVDDPNPSFSLKSKYRIKPETTKRLPTIEEVEKWFLENKVFYHNLSNMVTRIIVIDRNPSEKQIGLPGGWISIDKFCEEFTHLDGSELYISE